MKLRILLLLLILGSAQMAISQDDFIKATVGFSRSSMLVGDLDFLRPDEDFKSGFLIQATYNRPFNSNLYWGAGAGFYRKGFQSELTLFDIDATPIGIGKIKWRFNYIGFPVYLGFQKGHKSAFFAEFGFVPSFLSKSIVNQPDGSNRNNVDIDITEAVNDFDLPVFLLIGLRKELNDNYTIDLSLGAQQSLTGIGFIDFSTGDDRFHLALSVMVGVVYTLD